jgi:hypothetical protein
MALLLIVMNCGAPDAGGVLWACAMLDMPRVTRAIRLKSASISILESGVQHQ